MGGEAREADGDAAGAQHEPPVLAHRAQGEVAIREAIQEVASWSQEAAFTLTEHELGVASCSRHVIDAGSPAAQVVAGPASGCPSLG